MAGAGERRSRFRLARVAGIEIFVHYSWILIAGLVVLGFWGWLESQHPNLETVSLVWLSVLGAVMFFGSVLLHEYAHAVVARLRGIEVKGITLYLFGGATEADVEERSAIDEFVVAVVGPLTSLGIGGLLLAASWAIQGGDGPLPDLLGYLALVNLILAVFNMAPGLPLDGGRVFRSAVWAVTGDFDRATRWAATAGVVIGYGLTAVGLLSIWRGDLGGLWLAAIGWMISQSAREDRLRQAVRSTFDGLVAGDVMTSPVVTIAATASVAEAVRNHFSRRTITAYPVVDGERIVGLLTVAAVRSTPAAAVWKTTAGHIAAGLQPALIADTATPMSEVIAAISSSDGPARVLVEERGRLVGIISPTDILRRQKLIDLIEPALANTAHH